MTATAEVALSETRVVTVRFDRLLAIYAVVPLAFLLVLFDVTVLSGALRRALPSHPDRIAFFTIFFNLPHIIASHLIFFDPEYVAHYRKHLVGFGAGLLAASVGLYLVAPGLVLLLSLLFTYFHIITQQVGLTGAQLRTNAWTFTVWKWLVLAVTISAYLMTAQPGPPGSFRFWFACVACVLAIPACVFAWILHRRATHPGGRRYLWANQALFVGMLVFVLFGYPFFAVLMPRVIHDLTAFYVYGVHDHNRTMRTGGGPRNFIYALAARLRIPPWIAGPVLAVLVAFVVERVLPHGTSLVIVYVLSAFHYYLEGVVWKRGTPHRAFVAFV